MPLNNMGLGFVFTARNLASGTIKRLQGQLGGLSGQASAAGLAMRAGMVTAAAGVVPLAAGVGTLATAMSLANAAGEFQQGVAAVGAVSRATTEELQMLRNAAIQAGVETQFSPTEAIEGLQSLATAGQTARQATQTLIPVLDLAAGSLGQLGVSGAAESVVGTLNAYGMSADQAASVTDRLLRTTQLTNFQAADFSAGLSKAAATGAVFDQSLNDVLITMGLLRNRNIDASSSATAFREATRRLASDQGAQAAITEAGVKIFDEQTGAMRPVVDVLLDLKDATANMSAEERNSVVAHGLGARGLLAFNAVAEAQATVVRDGREEILKGADAIEYLRGEMENATGTAEQFREQLLDTFAGQKTLLEGTLQTFAVVLGEPFANVFKPLVRIIVDSLNFVLQVFNELPDGLKNTVASFIVAGGVFMSVVGIVAILTGLFLLLLPALKAIAIAIGVGLLALLPFIAAVGVAVAAVIGLREAFRANVGGIATFFVRMWNRISLAFQGLKQLFTSGEFSGAVMGEMNRAENSGIRQFVINIFRIGSRIMEFFQGIRAGFSAALDALAPTFERFQVALTHLWEAFGFVDEGAQSLADTPMDSWAQTGIRVGEVLADVLGFVVESITRVVYFWTGLTKAFRRAMAFLQPVFDVIKIAVADLGSAFAELFGDFDDNARGGNKTAEEMGSTFEEVFKFIGGIVAYGILGIVKAITWVIDAFNWLKGAASDVAYFMLRLSIQISTTFDNVVDSIRIAVDSIIAFVGNIMSKIPEAVRPQFANNLIAEGRAAQGRVTARTANAGMRTARAQNQLAAIDRLQTAEQTSRSNASAAREAQIADLTRELRHDREARQKERTQPVQVSVQVDGETIARASKTADRKEAARGFVPGVPSEVS